ncbi:hypothetical protein F4821DRAFT_176193 [Hypoxylon rubiginosum]|uniref:Uncharacterized protein n=1 Tax=Hypoxylon rubiginosum TaxID=110542 RepID=A0ACC0CVI1_9PEZI|nr:hypothetical protein F4821DRAFT_176193 [Hypoxylon rubiginosum]
MSEPYRPSDEERDEYYFGISGKPRLVARTSHHKWSVPKYERCDGTWRRVYKPLFEGKQPIIVSRWTEDLTLALVEALSGCSWSYFFPICIGFHGKFPTILQVAVEEDSLQWDEGVAIALKCRTILRDFHIDNVEVEIREGRYVDCAASTELERQIDPKHDNPWISTNELVIPMLSSLGYPIGYAGEQKAEGSLGLHIRLGDEDPAVYGLTCRHVVSDDRQPTESYTSSGDHKQYHVQGGEIGFSKCLHKLKQWGSEFEELHIEPLRTKKQRWEDGESHECLTEKETRDLAKFELSAAYHNKVIDLVDKISDKKDRQIGHLAFHPKSELSSERPGYLKDWALIKLDLNKFNDDPSNKVFINDYWRYYPGHDIWKYTVDGFFPLHLEPQGPEGSKPTTRVGKRGFATGLKFGVANGVEAVVRRPTWGKSQFACEMLIVSNHYKHYRAPFSDKGDSGSSIFDMQGRVVGLLNGRGDGTPDDDQALWGSDVTFATPIRWVLEDIKRFTGLEPRLA